MTLTQSRGSFGGDAVINTLSESGSLWHRLTAAFTAIALGSSFLLNPVLAQSRLGETVYLAQQATPVPVEPAEPIEPVGRPGQPRDWGSDIDIDPPIIDHEALKSGGAGQVQEFRAVVIDDLGLKHVWLFHRKQSGAQYDSVPMQRVDDTSEFVVSLDSTAEQERIEYYIEAVDTGGNRVLKGFPFFPLVRELNPAKTTNVADTSDGDNTLLYVLVGVAAIGLGLALLNGGDDGGPGTQQPEPEPGTVPLTIIVNPPE